MEPSYAIPKLSNHWFARNHPYYIDKLVGNFIQTFVYSTNFLHVLGGEKNLNIVLL